MPRQPLKVTSAVDQLIVANVIQFLKTTQKMDDFEARKAAISAYAQGLENGNFAEGRATFDDVLSSIGPSQDISQPQGDKPWPAPEVGTPGGESGGGLAGGSPGFVAGPHRGDSESAYSNAFGASAGRGPGPEMLYRGMREANTPDSNDGFLASASDATGAFAWHLVDSALFGLPRLAGWAGKALGAKENFWTEGVFKDMKETHTTAGMIAGGVGEVAGFLAPGAPLKLLGKGAKGLVGVAGAGSKVAKAEKLGEAAARAKSLAARMATADKAADATKIADKLTVKATRAQAIGKIKEADNFLETVGRGAALGAGETLNAIHTGGKAVGKYVDKISATRLFQLPGKVVEKVVGSKFAGKMSEEMTARAAHITTKVLDKSGKEIDVFDEIVATAREVVKKGATARKHVSPWRLEKGAADEIAQTTTEVYTQKLLKELADKGLSTGAANEVAEKAAKEFLETFNKVAPKSLGERGMAMGRQWGGAIGLKSTGGLAGGILGGGLEHGIDGAMNMALYGVTRRTMEFLGEGTGDPEELLKALKYGSVGDEHSNVWNDVKIGAIFHTGGGLKLLPWFGERSAPVKEAFAKYFRVGSAAQAEEFLTATDAVSNRIMQNTLKALKIDPRKYKDYNSFVKALEKRTITSKMGLKKDILPDLSKLTDDELRILFKFHLDNGMAMNSDSARRLYTQFEGAIRHGGKEFNLAREGVEGILGKRMDATLAQYNGKAGSDLFKDMVKNVIQFNHTFMTAGGFEYVKAYKKYGTIDLQGALMHAAFVAQSSHAGVWHGSLGVGRLGESYEAGRAKMGVRPGEQPGHAANAIERFKLQQELHMMGVPGAKFMFADPEVSMLTPISASVGDLVKSERIYDEGVQAEAKDFLETVATGVPGLKEKVNIVNHASEVKEGDMRTVTMDEIRKMAVTLASLRDQGYNVPGILEWDKDVVNSKDMMRRFDGTGAGEIDKILSGAKAKENLAKAVLVFKDMMVEKKLATSSERVEFTPDFVNRLFSANAYSVVANARKELLSTANIMATHLGIPQTERARGMLMWEELARPVGEGADNPEVVRLFRNINSLQQMFKSMLGSDVMFSDKEYQVDVSNVDLVKRLNEMTDTARDNLTKVGLDGLSLEAASLVLTQHALHVSRNTAVEAILYNGPIIDPKTGESLDKDSLIRALSSTASPLVFNGTRDMDQNVRYLPHVDREALLRDGMDPEKVNQLSDLVSLLSQVKGLEVLTPERATQMLNATEANANAVIDAKNKVSWLWSQGHVINLGREEILRMDTGGLMGHLRRSQFLTENYMTDGSIRAIQDVRNSNLSKNAREVWDIFQQAGLITNKGSGKYFNVIMKLARQNAVDAVKSGKLKETAENNLGTGDESLGVPDIVEAIRRIGGEAANPAAMQLMNALPKELDLIVRSAMSELIANDNVRGWNTDNNQPTGKPNEANVLMPGESGELAMRQLYEGLLSLTTEYSNQVEKLSATAKTAMSDGFASGRIKVERTTLDKVVSLLDTAMKYKTPADYRRILNFLNDADLLEITSMKGPKGFQTKLTFKAETNLEPGKIQDAMRRFEFFADTYSVATRSMDIDQILASSRRTAEKLAAFTKESGHSAMSLNDLQSRLGLNDREGENLRLKLVEHVRGKKKFNFESTRTAILKELHQAIGSGGMTNKDAATKVVKELSDYDIIGIVDSIKRNREQVHHYLHATHKLRNALDIPIDGERQIDEVGQDQATIDHKNSEIDSENPSYSVEPDIRPSGVVPEMVGNVTVAKEMVPANAAHDVSDTFKYPVEVVHLIDSSSGRAVNPLLHPYLIDEISRAMFGGGDSVHGRNPVFRDLMGNESKNGRDRRGVLLTLGGLPKGHKNVIPDKGEAKGFLETLDSIVGIKGEDGTFSKTGVNQYREQDSILRDVLDFMGEYRTVLDNLNTGAITEQQYWKAVTRFGEGKFRSMFRLLHTLRMTGENGLTPENLSGPGGFDVIVRHQQMYATSGSRIDPELAKWAVERAVYDNRQTNKQGETREYSPGERSGIRITPDGRVKIRILRTGDSGRAVPDGAPTWADGDMGLTSYLSDIIAMSKGYNPRGTRGGVPYGSIKALVQGLLGNGGHLTKPNMTTRPEFQSIASQNDLAGFIVDASMKINTVGVKNAVFELGNGKTTEDIGEAMAYAAATNGRIKVANAHESIMEIDAADINFQSMSYPEAEGATNSHQVAGFYRDSAVAEFANQRLPRTAILNAFTDIAGGLDFEAGMVAREAILNSFKSTEPHPGDRSDMDLIVKFLEASPMANPRQLGMARKVLELVASKVLREHAFKGHTDQGGKAAVSPDFRNTNDTGETINSHLDGNTRINPAQMHMGIKHTGGKLDEIHAGNAKRLGIEKFKGDRDFQGKSANGKDTGREDWPWGIYAATGKGEEGWMYNMADAVAKYAGPARDMRRMSSIIRLMNSRQHSGELDTDGYNKLKDSLNELFVGGLTSSPDRAKRALMDVREIISGNAKLNDPLVEEVINDMWEVVMFANEPRGGNPTGHQTKYLQDIMVGMRRQDGSVRGYDPHVRWRDKEGKELSDYGRMLVTYGITEVAQRAPNNQPNDGMVLQNLGYWKAEYGRQKTMNHMDVTLGEADYDKDMFNFWYDTNKATLAEVVALRNYSNGTLGISKEAKIKSLKPTDFHLLKSSDKLSEDPVYQYGHGQAMAAKARGVVISSRNLGIKYLRDDLKMSWKLNGKNYRLQRKHEFDLGEMVDSLGDIGGLIQSYLDTKKGMPSDTLLDIDPLAYVFDRMFNIEVEDKYSAQGWSNAGKITGNADIEMLIHSAVMPYRNVMSLSSDAFEGDASRSKPFSVIANEAAEYMEISRLGQKDRSLQSDRYKQVMSEYLLSGARRKGTHWNEVVNSLSVSLDSSGADSMAERVAILVNRAADSLSKDLFTDTSGGDAIPGRRATAKGLKGEGQTEGFISQFAGDRTDLQREVTRLMNSGFRDKGSALALDRQTGRLTIMNQQAAERNRLDIVNQPQTPAERYWAQENLVGGLGIEAALRATVDMAGNRDSILDRIDLYQVMKRARNTGLRELALRAKGEIKGLDKVMTSELHAQIMELFVRDILGTVGKGNELRVALEMMMPDYQGHFIAAGGKYPRFANIQHDVLKAIHTVDAELFQEVASRIAQGSFLVQHGLSGNIAPLMSQTGDMMNPGAYGRASKGGGYGAIEKMQGRLSTAGGYGEHISSVLSEHPAPNFNAIGDRISSGFALHNIYREGATFLEPIKPWFTRRQISAMPIVNQVTPYKDFDLYSDEGSGILKFMIDREHKNAANDLERYANRGLRRAVTQEFREKHDQDQRDKAATAAKFGNNEFVKKPFNAKDKQVERDISREISNRINRLISGAVDTTRGNEDAKGISGRDVLDPQGAKRMLSKTRDIINKNVERRLAESGDKEGKVGC